MMVELKKVEQIPCPDCKGVGYHWGSNCETCYGSAKVFKDEDDFDYEHR